MKKAKTEVRPSSGNVFADLGLKDPEEAMLKAQFASRIAQTIAARGFNQTEAARHLGIDQPKVSALLRGRLNGFSTDRLFKYVRMLGSDVEITLRDAREGVGHFELHLAV